MLSETCADEVEYLRKTAAGIEALFPRH